MKRFLVPLVLLIPAACAQVPAPGDGVRPGLAPLVFGGPGEEGVDSLAKRSTGVYVVGFTTDKPQPNPKGETDVFIRKYSSSRSVIWTRKFGTLEYGVGSGVGLFGEVQPLYVLKTPDVGFRAGSLLGKFNLGVNFHF